MKLLVVSPDFASHYTPLAAIGTAARRRGADVLVASGPAMAARIGADGFGWCDLRMSAGSNPGVLPPAVDDGDEDSADMAGFFAATRAGMIATLRYQADMRGADLLWRPGEVARSMLRIVEDEQPDSIVVDHLAFACALGLRAGGHPFTTFVPGHPSQLPVGDEIYGHPVAWPSWVDPDDAALAQLRGRCASVREAMTADYNRTLAGLAPGDTVDDAFAVHGHDVIYNAPGALRDVARDPLLPLRHHFLGSCARDEVMDRACAEWLGTLDGEPFVYVSLGTFLSARADVLRRIVDALVALGMPAAIATGSCPPGPLGALPPDWLVAAELPQVALLDRASAAVTHGGNNTVTEALAAGCPMVVLPFSTDQFSTAADLERTGLARSLDPNRARRAELAPAIADAVAAQHRWDIVATAETLRASPGADVAAARLLAGSSIPATVRG